MFGLKKFSPNIDELQILIIVLHFWPPIIKSWTVTETHGNLRARKFSAPYVQNWGEIWGLKISFPPSLKIGTTAVIFCMWIPNDTDWKPWKFRENPFAVFRDIWHFIYWSNARYMLRSKSYRRSQYCYVPTTMLLHKYSSDSPACNGNKVRENGSPGELCYPPQKPLRSMVLLPDILSVAVTVVWSAGVHNSSSSRHKPTQCSQVLNVQC